MLYRTSSGDEIEISGMKTPHLLTAYKKLFSELNTARMRLTKLQGNIGLVRKVDRLTPLVSAMRSELKHRKIWEEI